MFFCVETVGTQLPYLFSGGNAVPTLIHIFLWERSSYSVPSLYPLGLQGGPAKVKPLTFLLVTFECIGKIFGTCKLHNKKWCDANFVIINT